MRTEYLEYLLEVARTCSISAAAKKLFIGQTTLSAIINSVENELNVKIFLRTHRGVKLTEHGEQVIAIAEDMVEKNRRLLTLSTDTAPVRRNIPVVAYPSGCSILGLYLSQELREREGVLSLSMQEVFSTKVVSSVVNGMANIGVGASAKHEFFSNRYAAHNSGLQFEPIYNDRFCLWVSCHSHLADKQVVDVSELGDEHLAVTAAQPTSSSSTVGCVVKATRQLSMFNNMEVVKKAVMAENMITVLPRISALWDGAVEDGQLRLLELTGFETELTNFLVLNQRTGLNSHETHVVALIRRFFRTFSSLEHPDAPPDSFILTDEEISVQ